MGDYVIVVIVYIKSEKRNFFVVIHLHIFIYILRETTTGLPKPSAILAL